MGFLEGFFGGKKEEKKEEKGRINDGGDFMAVPGSSSERGPGEVDPEREITFLKGKIEAIKMDPNHSEADQLGSLEERLKNLVESRKKGL